MQESPFAPIPGTERPRHALFVGRFGTLFQEPERGHCARFCDLRFQTGAVEALFRAGQAGWHLYLIGNEPQVAFGRLSQRSWERLSEAFLEHLEAQGVCIRRSYACLDHPEGKAPHRRPSVFLLPGTGVFYHAAQEDGIALEHSWVLGARPEELLAGDRAGLGTCAIGQAPLTAGEARVEPRLFAPSLAAALDDLLQRDLWARI